MTAQASPGRPSRDTDGPGGSMGGARGKVNVLSSNHLKDTRHLAQVLLDPGAARVQFFPDRSHVMRRHHQQPWTSLAILAAFMLTAAASPAIAQHGAEQLADFIERTGEIVDWAAEQVKETENQQAHRVLEEAQSMHQRSLDLADQGRGVAALAMSRRARSAAQHATRLARDARTSEHRVQQRLERFLDYRDQVVERVREAGDERAQRFIREADEHALRARDHHRQGNHDLAMHLIESAEDMLSRASRLVLEGSGADRLQQEIERTRQAITTLADRLADRAATDLLDSAHTALDRAEDFSRRGQPTRALQSLRLARRLAEQADRASDGALEPEAVLRQLERWDGQHDLVAEQVQSSGSAAAAEALQRARHHRERAGTLHRAGDQEPALRQIKAAFDLLNEARELTR